MTKTNFFTCYICGSKHGEIFHTVSKYTYYLCSDCMTLYLSPLPSKKEIETYYKTNFTYTVVPATVKRLRQRAGHILEKLKSLNPDGISLLDIGSGYGYFLEEAKKTYMEGVGLEPSKKMYSHSKKAGLQVVNSALEDYHPKNKFDFITLIQIIEHVENPLQFLKKVETLMNKDAVLYIETPNLDSHLFHFEKESYTFLTPPDHLGIFSKKTFQELLSRTNLEILDVTTYSYPEHFMGVIKKILHSNPPLPSQTSFPSSTPPLSLSKKLKYILIDTMIASLLYKILNLNDKGTILELYIRKKK